MNTDLHVTTHTYKLPHGSFFIIFIRLMRRALLLLIFPCVVNAQTATNKLLEGYAEAGYLHELWVISQGVYNGYSAQDYTGNGFFAGGGVRMRMDSVRRWGFGLTVDYTQYAMSKTISAEMGAQRMYAFARLTPAANYLLNPRAKYKLTLQVNGAFMMGIRNNERSYWQYGFKAIADYDAYQASAGFNFSQGDKSPSGDIPVKWREQMFSLGIAVFPSRIKGFKRPATTKGKL